MASNTQKRLTSRGCLAISSYICNMITPIVPIEGTPPPPTGKRPSPKRRWRLLWLVILVPLAVLCFLQPHGANDESLTVDYYNTSTSLDATPLSDSLLAHGGWIEYDSVRFSDGSHAVYHLKSAPQNSLMEMFDADGKTLATVSRASECFAQTWVYGYDKEGRLTHVARWKTEMFDGLETDSTGFHRDRDGYLGFRKLIASLDYAHPDTARYALTTISYDDKGDAVEVSATDGGHVKAPRGHKFRVSVEPCPDFWTSDINGGTMELRIAVVPAQ